MSEAFLGFKSSVTAIIKVNLVQLLSIVIIVSEYYFRVISNLLELDNLSTSLGPFFFVLIGLFFFDFLLVVYLILLTNRFMGKSKYNWNLIAVILCISLVGRLYYSILLDQIFESSINIAIPLIVTFLFGLSIVISSYMILISISEFFFNRTPLQPFSHKIMKLLSIFNFLVFCLSGFMLTLSLISVLLYHHLSKMGAVFTPSGVIQVE